MDAACCPGAMARRSSVLRLAVALAGTCLAVSLPAHPLSAQTGLLVVGGEEAREAAARVRWSDGPVEVLLFAADPPGDVTLDAAVASLVARGAATGVVVVVVAGTSGKNAPPDLRPRAGGPVRVVVASPVQVAGDAASLPRRIEESARTALASLADIAPQTGRVYALDAVNVTATRTPLEVFGTAAPVTVLSGHALDRAAGEGDLAPLERIPGVELEGVGFLRRQASIRGFTGQRVLLLEDGIRLTGSRRRLASSEPAALAGSRTLERIEVVRGPSSVLHGSDAVGGVVNLVTRGADPGAPDAVTGSVRLSGSSAGRSLGATVDGHGRAGHLAARVTASVRGAGAYEAPAGRFGDVALPGGGTVRDTGGRDRQVRSEVAVALPGGGRGFIRGESHRSEDSGFGFIDPALLGDDPTRVRLTFPDQRYTRLVAGWRSGDAGPPWAEAVEATAWVQDNRRRFLTEVLAPLGPNAPADARLRVETDNRTDSRMLGGRVESTSLLRSHVLTWGLDAYRERSTGFDTTTTTVSGLGGPPRTTVRAGGGVPDATLSSVAIFAQDRMGAGTDTELTLGARYQDVRAVPIAPGSGTLAGPTFDAGRHVDRTVVGSGSLLHRPRSDLSLVASVARGFRSPNLVERFFSGPTPGGRGTWVRNPDLRAETSLTVDLGVRLRRSTLHAEIFGYRTSLRDGIRLELTGRSTETGPEYRNENVDAVIVRGLEAWAGWSADPRLDLNVSFAVRDRFNPEEPDDPFEEGVRTSFESTVVWTALPGRFDLRWRARWEGSHRNVADAGQGVGPEVPGYQLHDVQAYVILSPGHELDLGLRNVLDRLYALPGNAGFFRPEPGRRLVVGLTSRF